MYRLVLILLKIHRFMFKSAPFFFLWLVGLSGTLSGQQDSIIHAIKNASETEPYTIISVSYTHLRNTKRRINRWPCTGFRLF